MTAFFMPTRTTPILPSPHLMNVGESVVLSRVHAESGKIFSAHSLTRFVKSHPGWRISDDSRPPERL